MLDYNVLNEEQAENARFSLLPDGEYAARINSAISKQSQSGNPMIELVVDVITEDGRVEPIKDWLVFSDKTMWKVILFVKSCGLENEFVNKSLNDKLLLGQQVKVIVKTEEGKEIPFDKLNGKPAGTKYPNKNRIDGYVSRKTAKSIKELMAGKTVKNESNDIIDDDVPF